LQYWTYPFTQFFPCNEYLWVALEIRKPWI
jgi:hypothetical protein